MNGQRKDQNIRYGITAKDIKQDRSHLCTFLLPLTSRYVFPPHTGQDSRCQCLLKCRSQQPTLRENHYKRERGKQNTHLILGHSPRCPITLSIRHCSIFIARKVCIDVISATTGRSPSHLGRTVSASTHSVTSVRVIKW